LSAGVVAGIALGRWAALMSAVPAAAIAWIIFNGELDTSGPLLAMILGGLTAAGVVLGVLVRRAARELSRQR
jgi:hypothetical protein